MTGSPNMPTELDLAPLLRHVGVEEIPSSDDLFDAAALEGHLDGLGARFGLVAVGDIMLAGRARSPIKKNGSDYPFEAVLPLLRRGAMVLGNLEGPLARRAERQERNFSYRVHPDTTAALWRAGIRLVTLANNHLVDCGREGVRETMSALGAAGITRIGAGHDIDNAHEPAIFDCDGMRIGVLGYYWNRRCAATATLPGSAMDAPENLAADIGALRSRVDRVVATFHWGIPYEREPLPEDRMKARLAIDLGADAVIGHHPHVIQPFEIHRERPIFYSVGNFAFGSGNSKGEGLALGLRFERDRTLVTVHPLYVKNRDPRVAYQPKVLRGDAASRVLARLARASGEHGPKLRIEAGRGVLDLPAGRAVERAAS
jgi:poly-gamma-glutamate capsule biosynthesis protein CapA/YwtB (metallophosphatase superfamily)